MTHLEFLFSVRYVMMTCICTAYATLLICGETIAQTSVIENHTPIYRLRVGDTIPESIWNLPLNTVNHPEGKNAIKLNDYRGNFIILDFWATTCVGCVALLPRIDSLQKHFGNAVTILPVTSENANQVFSLAKRTKSDLVAKKLSVISDSTLLYVFESIGIPHLSWIDQNGVLRAATSGRALTVENIVSMMQSPTYKLDGKHQNYKSTAFDVTKPLASELPPDSIGFSITLTGHDPRYKSQIHFGIGALENRRVLMINMPISNLFRIAYAGSEYYRKDLHLGFPFNRTVIEIDKPEELKIPSNTWCIDLILPKMDIELQSQVMQDHLNRCSPYAGKIVEKEMPCYILDVIDSQKPKTAGADTLIDHSALHLRLSNQPVSKVAKILDYYLGAAGHIILSNSLCESLVNLDIEAQLSDIDEVSRALIPQGLVLKKEFRKMDILIIKEKEIAEDQRFRN